MGLLQLDTESIARLITSRAKPHARSSECAIAANALRITLRGVDVQKPFVPLIDIVVDVRATLESPDTMGVALNITRVGLLPVSLIKPLVKPIVESMLAKTPAGVVEVVTADRLVIHIDKILLAGRSLPEIVRVDRVQIPGPAPMAVHIEFQMNG
jgi:hypothetical protein